MYPAALAMRARRGAIDGGDGGREVIAQAHAELVACGLKNAPAIVRMFAPGFE
jgi:hypothetical protein